MSSRDQTQLAVEKEYEELVIKGEYVTEKDSTGKEHKVWAYTHSPEDAQQLVLEKYYREEAVNYLKLPEEEIYLRISYSILDLETTQTVQESGGWYSMSVLSQENFLYELGLDSPNFGWKLCEGTHLNIKGRQVKGAYLFSQERTDDEWVSALDGNGKNVASFEAQLVNRGDPSLNRELAYMSKTEQWVG